VIKQKKLFSEMRVKDKSETKKVKLSASELNEGCERLKRNLEMERKKKEFLEKIGSPSS
jgi:hypothetical protein